MQHHWQSHASASESTDTTSPYTGAKLDWCWSHPRSSLRLCRPRPERLVNDRFATAERAGIVVPYGSPALSSQLSVPTDATASNLVGTGRVLGLAYDAAGKVVEKHLNALAVRFGFGPGATAHRIRSRWHYYLRDLWPTRTLNDLRLPRKKRKKLEKKCKRLLEYARSNVVSTQIRALDLIVDLIISDPYFRDVVRQLDAARILADVQFQSLFWRNAEASPLYRSALRAVISVGETKLYDIAEKISHGDIVVIHEALPRLCNNLRDPEVSFLAMRYLIRLHDSFTTHMNEADHAVVPLAVRDLMTFNPDFIEWSSLDDLLYECLKQFWVFDVFSRKYDLRQITEIRRVWPTWLEIIFRHADRLPSPILMIKQYTMRLEPDNPNDLAVIAFPFWLWLVFEGIAEAVQSSVSALNYVLDDLRMVYPSVGLLDVWRILFCPPIVLYREILLERRKGFLFGDGITWVPNAVRLSSYCRQMVSYLKFGLKYNCDQAVRCVNAVLRLDRYCFNAMSDAIREEVPEMADSRLFNLNLTERYLKDMSRSITLYRHKTSDGRVHLRLWQFCDHDICDHCFLFELDGDELPNGPKEKQTYISEAMTIQDTDVLWLEVSPNSPFECEGHLPILAGRRTSFAREQYIAAVSEEPERALAGWSGYQLCTVSDGDAQVEFVSHGEDYAVLSSTRFAVLVLRFDSCTYPKISDCSEDADHPAEYDTSGPMAWRPVIDQCANCV